TTHSHYDHTGNNTRFKEAYGCRIAASVAAAGMGYDYVNYWLNYIYSSPKDMDSAINTAFYRADEVFWQDCGEFEFCGVKFGILDLPGHAIGTVGVVTPDDVAYLSDAICDYSVFRHAKSIAALSVAEYMNTLKKLKRCVYDKYIVAHRGVYDDIARLIEVYEEDIRRRMKELFDCLRDDMSRENWLFAFGEKLGFASKSGRLSPVFEAIFERNFNCGADYLLDMGYVEQYRINGVRYYKRIEQEYDLTEDVLWELYQGSIF
ncbi:MAG: hypothetical protein IJG63_09410, partial [Oscillospiraceae bacterium]|nr:hypothetical protein [Oscillospiraceae bacterium]